VPIHTLHKLIRYHTHPTSILALLLFMALLAATSSAEPVSGEGYLLSKNADFSTDDRSFDPGDALYVLVWSEQVDHMSMKKQEWELKDASNNKLKQDLTNLGDGSFSAVFSLADLPSNAMEWAWKGKLQDNNKAKYQAQTDITVGGAGEAGGGGEAGDGGQSPCTTGECFVLSKNADFSTDDRSFTFNDTLHMYVFSDQVDSADIKKSEWELKDAEKAGLKQDLAHHVEGSFTASYSLSDLPSELASWTWKGKLQDNNKAKYQPTATIAVTLGSETVADFSSAPAIGVVPLPVDFEDHSTENPTSWDWDFGDGEVSTEQNPSHIYETEGAYSVTLRAGNAMGSDTMIMADYIIVPEPASAIQLISGALGLFALNLRRRRH
jgi:hypothetical protein